MNRKIRRLGFFTALLVLVTGEFSLPRSATAQILDPILKPIENILNGGSQQSNPATNYQAQVRQEFNRDYLCVITDQYSKAQYDAFPAGYFTGTVVKQLALQLTPCMLKNGIGFNPVSVLLSVGFTSRNVNDAVVVVVYAGRKSSSASKPGSGSGSGSGKNRPGLPSPVPAVDGTFQIFKSNLPSCKPGNYRVAGSFDSSFTTFTLAQAGGAEGCFSSVPAQVFAVPGLTDGGPPVKFESRVGTSGSRIVGNVSRIYGSFITSIIYPDTPKTYGILALNSQNTKVKGNSEKGVLDKLPGSPNEKGAKNFPELIPAAATEAEIVRDTRPSSETNGLRVVRNQLKIVFFPEVTVDEVNSALTAVGGAIIGSSPGVTAVTIKIPDLGNLDGLDRAGGILSGQPKVLTTVPIIIREIPELLSFPRRGLPPAPLPPEFIPMPLQLVGAVDKDGKRPKGLGSGQVNLFVADKFSNPLHRDVNLVNPLSNLLRFLDHPNIAGWSDSFQDQYSDRPNPPAGITCTEEQYKRKDTRNCQKYDHGYMVTGLMAAREKNGIGVVGMYPAENKQIFALNAASSNVDYLILFALQRREGNHVLNLSIGSLDEDNNASVANREGLSWTLEIRQRGLENRVIIAASAGNSSDRSKGKIAKAEYNSPYTAAGLGINVKEVLELRLRQCQNTWLGLGIEGCTTNVLAEIPRLNNTLVVENFDVTGDYSNFSSEVTTNPLLAVRAIGNQSTPRCFYDKNGNGRADDKGFPYLTFDSKIDCVQGGGTSSAAPQVAGLAGWLWSHKPDWTAPKVVQRIRDCQTKFHALDGKGDPAVDELSPDRPLLSIKNVINVRRTLDDNDACRLSNVPPPPSLNRLPVANNDTATVPPYGSVDINVLANDTDPDGDSLTVTNVTQGSKGSVAIGRINGVITYSSGPGVFNTTDTFTYTISDGKGGTATATVSITIR
jgi:hypothetical protein